jgi:GNAT superfamily N-acetyltransferase
MSYIEESPDEKHHKFYHDRVVNGVYARPLKTDRSIWRESERRITIITANSPTPQRKRAEVVVSVANLETHYNGGIYHAYEEPDDRNIHLFLFHMRNRIIGLLIIEKRQAVWRCRWQDNTSPVCEELSGHDPMWSVVFVWVHAKHRKHGIAHTTFEEAIKYLGLTQQRVGWYAPLTDNGRSLVKSIYPKEFYVAK